MNFKSFIHRNLNESIYFTKDASEAASLVVRDCVPFLKESDFQITPSGVIRNGLYRGIDSASLISDLGYMLKIPGRNKDRTPKDTSEELHAILNDYLQKEFGIPYRSRAVFCSNSPLQASNYGLIYLIFPIGSFDYVYSEKISDAFIALDRQKVGELPRLMQEIKQEMNVTYPREISSSKEFDFKAWYSLVKKWLEEKHPYTDTNLSSILAKENSTEIMLHCKEYYAVLHSSMDFSRDFKTELRKLL